MSKLIVLSIIQLILILGAISVVIWQIVINTKTSNIDAQVTATNATSPKIIYAYTDKLQNGSTKYTAIFTVIPTNVLQAVTATVQFGSAFASKNVQVLSARAEGTYIDSSITRGIQDIGASILNGTSTSLNTVVNFQPSLNVLTTITVELIA